MQGYDQTAASGMVAVLTQVDALPGSRSWRTSGSAFSPRRKEAEVGCKKGFSARAASAIWQVMKFLSKVYVQLKESILDPQGQAVLHALHNMEHSEVEDVRIGKYIELRLDAPDEEAARKQVAKHCDGLLANPVIETYRFDLEPLA